MHISYDYNAGPYVPRGTSTDGVKVVRGIRISRAGVAYTTYKVVPHFIPAHQVQPNAERRVRRLFGISGRQDRKLRRQVKTGNFA